MDKRRTEAIDAPSGDSAARGPAERGPAERGPAERGPAEGALSDRDRQLIAEANAVAVPSSIERDVERGLYDQFRARATRRPDHPAIRHGDDTVAYAALQRRVEARARQLIALGVRPGDLVGLCGVRGIPLFEGMLAISAAGAGYVPIDTEFPDDRLTFMVEDAALDVVVTTSDLAARFGTLPVTVHLLDAPHEAPPSTPLPEIDGRFPAYVIFTSGSTGRPKGVVTPQHAVTRLLRGSNWFDPSDDEVISQVASSSFDASTLEIWGALLAGATFVVIDKAQLIAPEHLAAALRHHGVTRWVITTAYFQQFARQEPAALELLNAIYFGGERCDPVAIREAATACQAFGTRLINCYGPTETTVVATIFDVDEVDEHATSVAIGRPIEDTTAHVVDAQGREVGVGVPGELWLGGPRLADGYLRRPALTAERFVPDPFGGPDGAPVAGARCYRTGDLVRWLADGQLDFLGRIDHQIKLRGFRIEPGEIETVLARHPQVADTVVLLRQDPNREPELVAYATPAETTPRPTPILLRDYLVAALPDYMVPSAVVVLDTFPITPSGKLDRRALPAPERDQAAHRPPTTDLEKSIRQVWSEFLGLDRIGLDDDFFQLGGHSLVVARLISRLRETVGVELPLVALFEHSTLGELSAEVERLLASGEDGGATHDELPPIVKVPRDGSPLPLSYPQERVWLLHQLDPTSTAYNFQMTVWFDGSLDVDALRRTLTEIVRRHEVFHCTFPAIDGEPAMVLHGPWQVELPTTDLRHVADDELDAATDRRVEEAVKTPFDVTELPLIRWQVIHLRDDRHLLIQVEHHFVHDGWSLGLLLKELKAIYPAFAAGEPSPLQDVEIQFGDFSTWQRKVIAGERLAGLVGHWKQTLDGMPTVLDLPTDHPRPNRPSTRGDARVFALPDALYAGLRAFGKEHGFTLYMTMLASFKALMYRYTGALDMGIGSGVANRRQKEQESIIGMMVNTVVMRGKLDGDPTFTELLQRTRGVSLDAFAHQDMPFERLVEALQPERHVSRNPVFQVMFSFHDAQVPDLDFGEGAGAWGSFMLRTNRSAKTDLNVIVAPQAEQSVGQQDDGRQRHAIVVWEYNRELFEPETIDRMIDHYLTLAADAIAHPEKHLSELVMVGDDERAAIRGYSRADADYPRETALFERFRATAEAHPDTEAVVYADSRGTDRATYAQLLDRASRLAGHLAAQGVRPGDLVGLATARGVDMTVGMLGILGAGGAYVPLDPSYPAERLALMVEDTGMPLVVAQQAIAEQMPLGELPTVLLDAELDAADAPPVAVDGGFPAYVIYTSGSTGKPKGAVIPQRAVTRLVCGTNFFDFAPGRRIAQVSNASFDAATFEIWGALLHGGTLVGVEPSAVQSPEDLAAALGDAEIDGLFVTTALFHQLVQQTPELFPRLGTVMFGGERCDPGLVRRCLEQPPKRLLHVYGPTESTTFATFEPVTEVAEGAPSVPIGGPLANTELLVLDRDGTPTPVGVVGELCLGGDGLALGYHRRPGLTAERFVPHPSPKTPGERVYRTGDLVRWTADGSIDFVGRLDFQVKVRGFRIELGEIAAVLEQHDAVGGAVVLAREDAAAGVGSQDRRVVAYVTPAEGSSVDTLDLDALRDVTAERLPDYMVPAAFVALDTFPLNANGKVDRRALPAPEYSRVEGRDPETDTELRIAEIWSELLPVDRVGADDDFFSLGGHSLLATQLVSRLRKAFGIQVGLGQIFDCATVARQAELIDASTPTAAHASTIRNAEAAELVDQAATMTEADLDALLGEMLDESQGGLT